MSQPEITDIESDMQGSETNSGGLGGMVPDVGLSRRHMLILGVVALAALAWYLRQRSTESGGSPDDAPSGEDLADVKVRGDGDGDGEVVIEVPTDPDDELDKDAAVIDALKTSGKIDPGEGDG